MDGVLGVVCGGAVFELDVVLAVYAVMLVGEGFVWPLELVYMYSLSLPLPLLSFEWQPDVWSQNLLVLVTCLSLAHICLASLTLDM